MKKISIKKLKKFMNQSFLCTHMKNKYDNTIFDKIM